MTAQFTQSMLKIIQIRLEDLVKYPDLSDPADYEAMLAVLEHKSPAEFMRAIAIWIYADEINFKAKKPWVNAYNDDPWIGNVLQTAWDSIEWNAIAQKLAKLIQKFPVVANEILEAT